MKTSFVLLVLLFVRLPGSASGQIGNANYHAARTVKDNIIRFEKCAVIPVYLNPACPRLSYLVLPPGQYTFILNDTTGGQEKSARPPIKAGRIFVEYVMGIVGAWAGTVVSIPFYLDKDIESLDMPYLLLGNISLGSAVVVYTTGNYEGQTGSFWASLLGSAIGTSAAVYLVTHDNEGYYLWLAPPLGATIGFTLTREYKFSVAEKRETTDFIN